MGSSSKKLNHVAFSSCCFLRSEHSVRAKLVFRAINSWRTLLDLDLGKRYFVDDRSPKCAGILLLQRTDVASQFDEIHYVPFRHEPNSNFGIAYSCGLPSTPYILHLDDDVTVQASQSDIESWLTEAVEYLEQDPSILGVNLLTINRNPRWQAATPYAHDKTGRFAHPKEYFGSCASIMRRELMEYVTLDEIRSYGDKQPADWEKMLATAPVSLEPQRFLVATGPTPFIVDERAWKTTALQTASLSSRAKSFVKARIPEPWLEKLRRPE